jgi:hypothetical protein
MHKRKKIKELKSKEENWNEIDENEWRLHTLNMSQEFKLKSVQ